MNTFYLFFSISASTFKAWTIKYAVGQTQQRCLPYEIGYAAIQNVWTYVAISNFVFQDRVLYNKHPAYGCIFVRCWATVPLFYLSTHILPVAVMWVWLHPHGFTLLKSQRVFLELQWRQWREGSSWRVLEQTSSTWWPLRCSSIPA